MKDIRLILKLKNNLMLKRCEALWGNITQSEMAEKIGLSETEFGCYVNFKKSPIKKKCGTAWKDQAVKIAEALNCSPEDIFPLHFQEIRKNQYQLELNSQVFIENKNPEDEMIEKENREEIRKLLGSLSPREEKILRLRFGIGEDEEYTLEEIGEMFGLNRNRILQIESTALRKLHLRKGGT